MAKSTPTHVVLRTLEGPEGRVFQRDERVDARGWRNVAGLERKRDIRPLSIQDLDSGVRPIVQKEA